MNVKFEKENFILIMWVSGSVRTLWDLKFGICRAISRTLRITSKQKLWKCFSLLLLFLRDIYWRVRFFSASAFIMKLIRNCLFLQALENAMQTL
ncbi:CLUMA_CG017610, isoform A [Clunio marinus]|uniref:CLUMA_CG017610, isoform A n=1 Tax=Clunio marinus TaxID=568069 RepID=A0A1J1J110_9DIPT|nr:CLUMA_CG017610, isoform A [Clunio marinus]